MTEDREIDALIAEKVFGNTVPHDFNFGDTCLRCGMHRGWAKDGTVRCVPRYTTNAADSKALRDRLAEKWEWLMSRMDGPAPYLFTLFEKSEHGNGAEVASAAGPTEEMTVALCALKAIGVEL